MFRMFIGVCLAAALTGCGASDDFGPTGTATGRLTLAGQPLQPRSLVIFVHPEKGYLAYGTTDAQGQFAVDSWNNGQMPIGTYQVMIQPPVPQAAEGAGDLDALMNNPKANIPTVQKADFPVKYRTTKTSGLSYDVLEGANAFNIDLLPAPVAPKK